MLCVGVVIRIVMLILATTYSAAKLKGFAERFAALAVSRDVYVHFKHEDEQTGALNAVAFLKRVAGVKRR